MVSPFRDATGGRGAQWDEWGGPLRCALKLVNLAAGTFESPQLGSAPSWTGCRHDDDGGSGSPPEATSEIGCAGSSSVLPSWTAVEASSPYDRSARRVFVIYMSACSVCKYRQQYSSSRRGDYCLYWYII